MTSTDNLTLVDVKILFNPQLPNDIDEVTVAIGDGKTKFDENFDFDARVYFYFDDLAQFKRAQLEELEEVGFQIVEVVDQDVVDALGQPDFSDDQTTPTSARVHVGNVAVDSGQVMVGDPCYLGDWKDNDFSEEAVATGASTYDYAGACAQTLSGKRAGELGNASAVVSATAWGDGVYPVYATYDQDGRIVKLEVLFDDEEVED